MFSFVRQFEKARPMIIRRYHKSHADDRGDIFCCLSTIGSVSREDGKSQQAERVVSGPALWENTRRINFSPLFTYRDKCCCSICPPALPLYPLSSSSSSSSSIFYYLAAQAAGLSDERNSRNRIEAVQKKRDGAEKQVSFFFFLSFSLALSLSLPTLSH